MKLIRSLYLTLIIFLLLFPYNAYSESKKTNSLFDAKNGEITISSISYDLDMKKSVFLYRGDVDVRADDISMSCQKLELYFKASSETDTDEGGKFEIDKIVASESVIVKRPGGRTATAEQAIYYHQSEKIILTGNPYLKDGDRFEGGGAGTVVTLDLKNERYTVQGTKENKATAKAKIQAGDDEER